MKTLIIPAAGLATRLRPISNAASKAMVPVNGKPLITYILDNAISVYDEIVIVHGQNTDVKRFCTYKYGNKIKYAYQEFARGPLHAVYIGLEHLDAPPDDLTIWLGDTIVTDYQHTPEDVLVCSRVPDYARWCMVSPDGTTLYDKPFARPQTDLALVGVYHFADGRLASDITETIIKIGDTVRGEYQLSQLINTYMDVHPMQVQITEEWFDCGDLPSLYDSSARLLKKFACRPDSSVYIDLDRGTFTKTGDRCANEAYWYANISGDVKPFLPALYNITRNAYTMELLSGSTVSDILLYEDLSVDSIKYIISKCLDSWYMCFGQDLNNDSQLMTNADMFGKKSIDRVSAYHYDFVSDSDKALMIDYVKRITEKEDRLKIMSSQIHGDFHTGNIIFTALTGKVKFIDPRGNWAGQQSTGGNPIYDLVKFAQSFYGDYIWIYAGVNVNETVKRACIDVFVDWCKTMNIDHNFIFNLVPVLMCSILDFHTDSKTRQMNIHNKCLEMMK